MAELATDVTFENLACSFKSVWQGIWIYNGGWSQRITRDLYMGGEVTYLAFQGGQSMMTLGARYALDQENVVNVAIGRQPNFKAPGSMAQTHNFRAQYTRRISERCSLGTEFEYVFPEHSSELKIGYDYAFKTGRVQGLIDTQGRVSCAVADHKSGFGFSGMIDYMRNDYKFGMMVQYFPMPEPQPGDPAGAPF